MVKPHSQHVHTTYAVSAPARLVTTITAISLDQPTPLHLTTHHYFALSGLSATNILKDSLHMPLSHRMTATNKDDIPTGEILDIASHPIGFVKPKLLGEGIKDSHLCSTSPGIDNCYIIDHASTPSCTEHDMPALIWSSPDTGVRMTMRTNQNAVQIFTANPFKGTKALKKGQGEGGVQQYGCMAVEPQPWIDAVNHPEWNQKVVYGPLDPPCVNWAQYDFDTI